MKQNKEKVSALHLILAAVLLLGLVLHSAAIPANAADGLSSSEIREQIEELERIRLKIKSRSR